MSEIVIVDVCSGNLRSVERALARVGGDVRVTRDPDVIRRADKIVVPGQGAFGVFMRGLRERGLGEALREAIASGKPYLGICLGLQLLFAASDEDGAATLGALPGRTVRLIDAPTLPHIGWNQADLVADDPLFAGIADGSDFYFVHSYAGEPVEAATVLARTTHGRPFVSAVRAGRLLGVQFHPERSGSDGLRLLGNFVGLVRTGSGSAVEVTA
jgi:glutamine amidotransferase